MQRFTFLFLALFLGGLFVLSQSIPAQAIVPAALTPTSEPATATFTPTPTDTPVPPTNTPTNTPVPSPTNTSMPGATNTPAPPTATVPATATPLPPETLPETGAPGNNNHWSFWLAGVTLLIIAALALRRRTSRG